MFPKLRLLPTLRGKRTKLISSNILVFHFLYTYLPFISSLFLLFLFFFLTILNQIIINVLILSRRVVLDKSCYQKNCSLIIKYFTKKMILWEIKRLVLVSSWAAAIFYTPLSLSSGWTWDRNFASMRNWRNEKPNDSGEETNLILFVIEA